MRILGTFAVACLIVYGITAGGLALVQRRLMYPGAQGGPPTEAPAGTQAIAIVTADGETLHGLWRPPEPGAGVIVSFHGNGSLPAPFATRFTASPWRESGWGVLALAYRGYPGSTGSPSEEGLIRDGIAAYLAAVSRAPGAAILLHGHSLGAAIAVAVAERAPHLGLYLEAPFDSMSHLVALRYPHVPTGLALLDTYHSDARIAGGTAPVLIVQGDADPVVPAKLARRLAEAAGPRAAIDMIAGGDHVSIFGIRDAKAEAMFRPSSPRPREESPHAPAR